MSLFTALQRFLKQGKKEDKDTIKKENKKPETELVEKKDNIKPQADPVKKEKVPSPALKSKQRKKTIKTEKQKKIKKPPLLDKNTDLLFAMQEARTETEEKIEPHLKRKAHIKKNKRSPILKDKNGIPILREETDFFRIFKEKDYKGKVDEDFKKDLLKNLEGKKEAGLLRAKKESFSSGTLTLEERIKRYPPVQKYIDLHGFTAIQARLKTEFFLEDAKKEGIFTVNIITGRGLHSQGPAVLPYIVEEKLKELQEKEVVLSWQWDNEEGISFSGSVKVFLRYF